MEQTTEPVPGLRNNGEIATEDNRPTNIAPNYIQAATSQNTRIAYQADIRHFICFGGHLPALSDEILRYLRHFAATLNPRTLSRRLTALRNWHLYQGFADPTAHPAVRKTLTGIRNVHGRPKEKARPFSIEDIAQMSACLKKTGKVIDCRNRALLLTGFFGAFRGSELAHITWENMTYVTEGMEIMIPRSKTDQGGEGQICAIPKSDDLILCPVTALIEWQKCSGGNTGPVFRRITPGGRVQAAGIQPRQVNMIVKDTAKLCGLKDAKNCSSHSLRRGFATEASKQGAPFGSIMRHGRWRHEGTVLGYIDEGKRFDQNAASIMLDAHKTRNKTADEKIKENT